MTSIRTGGMRTRDLAQGMYVFSTGCDSQVREELRGLPALPDLDRLRVEGTRHAQLVEQSDICVATAGRINVAELIFVEGSPVHGRQRMRGEERKEKNLSY